jgi:hypothetical protein
MGGLETSSMAPTSSAAARAAAPGRAAGAAVRELWRPWLHLVVLSTLAFAQPVFTILADSPDYVIGQGTAWADLILFALGFVLGPATVAVALELFLWRRPRWRHGVHLVFVAGLFAAFAAQALKDPAEARSRAWLVVALAIGAGFAFAYHRWRFLPMMLTVLAPLPLAVVVWFLAFSPVAGVVSAADPKVDSPPVARKLPVVLLVWDELSTASLIDADAKIDPARFPNLAMLAAGATWYPNATTVADNTTRAVPAILSGRLGDRDDLPLAADHPANLFERLAREMPFNVEEPITRLCPPAECPGTRPGMPTRLRTLVKEMGSLLKRRVLGEGTDPVGLPGAALMRRPEDVREFVAALGPGLNVLHVELPHVPYWYTPSGRRYTKDLTLPGLSDETWTRQAAPVESALRRYVWQLGLVDRLVGELVRRLRATGLYDRALIVVVADHGVSFQPGLSRREVSLFSLGEIAGVPLIVKEPGQRRGRVDRRAARTVDIVPTIGDVLGADWGGRSLLGRPRAPVVAVSPQFGSKTVRAPLETFQGLRDAAAERVRRLAVR